MSHIQIAQKEIERLETDSVVIVQRLTLFADAIQRGAKTTLIDYLPILADAERWCGQYKRVIDEIVGQVDSEYNPPESDAITFDSLRELFKQLACRQSDQLAVPLQKLLEWVKTLRSSDAALESTLSKIDTEAEYLLNELLQENFFARTSSETTFQDRIRPLAALYFLVTNSESPYIYFEAVSERFGGPFAFAASKGGLAYDSSCDVLEQGTEPFSLKMRGASCGSISDESQSFSTAENVVSREEQSTSDKRIVSETETVNSESKPEPQETNSPAPTTKIAEHASIQNVATTNEYGKDILLEQSDDSPNIVSNDSAILLEDFSEEMVAEINRVIWMLATTKHCSLALHLSQFLEKKGIISELPPGFFRIKALLPALSGEFSSFTNELHDELPHLLEYLSKSPSISESSHILLTLSSILWPALVYPIAIPRDMLHFGNNEQREILEPLVALFEKIREIIAVGEPFSPTLLQGNSGLRDWDAKLNDVKNQAQNWLENNQSRSFKYKPASDLYKFLVAVDGPLGRICSFIINDQRDQIAELQKFDDQWKSASSMIRKYEVQIRGEGASKRNSIECLPLNIMKNCSENLRQIVIHCKECWNNPPNMSDDRLVKKAEECRRTLLPMLEQALKRADSISSDGQHKLEVRTAAALFSEAAHLLASVFQGESLKIDKEEDVRIAKQHELLLIDGIRLDDDWNLIGGYGRNFWVRTQSALSVHRLLEDGENLNVPIDWVKVLEEKWKKECFAEAEKILEVLRRNNFSEIKRFSEDHRVYLEHAQNALKLDKMRVQQDLENANMKGLIENEDDRLQLLQELDVIMPEECLDIAAQTAKLVRIAEDINKLKKEQIADFQSKLEQPEIANLPNWQECKDAIMRLVDQEDLATAFEYREFFKENGRIPETIETLVGCDFYPDFFAKAEQYFSHPDFNVPDFHQALRDCSCLGDIDLSKFNISEDDAEMAAQAMETWNGLRCITDQKTPVQPIKDAVQTILENNFSFEVQDIKYDEQLRQMRVQVRPLDTRKICPLPDYGSDVKGRYNVLVLPEWPRFANDLFENHLPGQGEARVIVFLPHPLSNTQRQDLADEYVKNYANRRVLVLDTVLLLFCLLQPKHSRLAFFNGAGMFSVASPYRTQPGTVPIEMFYGRDDEAERLFDRYGSCLLYGGRQLGKTALLKEVKRRYNDRDDLREKGTIVEYIDIKAAAIGTQRPMNDIWNLIATKLPAYVLNTHSQVSKFETFSKGIKNWVDKKTGNRILILLDETDDFLNKDSEPKDDGKGCVSRWQLLLQFKQLLEETDRRFKVVFAGLHNVQRTSKDSNSPIHHFGEPTCIGPFRGFKDMADAINMIRIPFTSMGFRFESHDIIGKILARSIYYPSLIQIFCCELLAYMKKRVADDMDSCPPYIIDSRDIETVAASKSVQANIRDRFNWTLDLDNRFRVIALSMALQTSEWAQSKQNVNSFTVDEIMRMVMDWWPEGFKGTQTSFSLRLLLEEMVELGVLRKEQRGADEQVRFTLRSPNVQRLLGSSEEILDQLDHASQILPPPTPSNTFFRRIIEDEKSWWRSPLSQPQEDVLRNPSRRHVIVYRGNTASGINEVHRVISSLQTKEKNSVNVFDLSQYAQLHEFIPVLRKLVEQKSKNTELTILYVDSTAPWTMEWLKAAQEKASRHKGKVKVIFIADAKKCWEFLDAPRWDRNEQTEWISLEPWHDEMVRSWKREQGFGADTEAGTKNVKTATGFWWAYLTELGEKIQKQPERWGDELANYLRIDAKNKLDRFDLLPGMLPVFQAMAVYGEAVSVKDILDEVGTEYNATLIEKILQWGQAMNLVRCFYQERNNTVEVDEIERFQLDTFFSELVRNHRDKENVDEDER